MKILLFDIDGTLLRAGSAPMEAFCSAFSELFGTLHVWGNIDPSGRTDPWIIREVCKEALSRELSATEFDQLCESYILKYQELVETAEGFIVLPGVAQLCTHLSARDDIALGLQTGNIERAGRLKLRRAGVNEYFPFGGFGSDHFERPEIVRIGIERACQHHGLEINRSPVFVIGDTPHDIAAGKASGAVTIAVATGNSTADTLRSASPDHIFENFSEVDAFLQLVV